MENQGQKLFFTTSEVAKLFKVSRITIFNRIKNGSLRAEKIGRNYFIKKEEVDYVLNTNHHLSIEEKQNIKQAVDRAVLEYGEALKMLGKE